MNVIDHFMWGYQQHYQVSVQIDAEALFNSLDTGLKPKVFLIGILVDDLKDRRPVCLEPENCGYSVKSFEDVHEIAEEIAKVDGEGNLIHMQPLIQSTPRMGTKAYLEAIRRGFKKEKNDTSIESFISTPIVVEGYLVFVVLEVSKDALRKHYSLSKVKIRHHFLKTSKSLIESAIDVFLKTCSHALKEPNPGENLNVLSRRTDELLREAGQQFMYTFSQAGNNLEGLHGLYEACNTISSLKYEGTEGLGKMVIARRDHPNVKLTLELDQPIRMRDFHKVRKFLELSEGNSLIVTDSYLIYGLGETTGSYNSKDESLFIINFTQHFQWEVTHDNKKLMKVAYRQPSLPKERLDKEKFYSDFKRIFKDLEDAKIDVLWNITLEATKQTHGTMLVISTIAKREAKRLGNQSFKLKPLKLDPEIIHQITAIDGAVLLDTEGICYAIGVILDGVATSKGDSSRGARYNSAIRYYEFMGKKNPTVLVVISEDGIINLIPNLKSQIKHSIISQKIEELSNLSEQTKFERKEYNQLINWFYKFEFYLTASECAIINQLRHEIDERDRRIGETRVSRHDLKPNIEMNKTFYLEE